MRLPHALLWSALTAVPCFATAGLAEWEIKTPGGNLISHVDPHIATHGTCLRSDKLETIYVSRLEWWRYYRGAVAGKAERGFFLFDEANRAVRFFETREALAGTIRERRLGASTSAQLTAADGWYRAWGPFFLKTCQELDANGPRFQGLDEAAKAGMRSMCADIGKRAPAAPRPR